MNLTQMEDSPDTIAELNSSQGDVVKGQPLVCMLFVLYKHPTCQSDMYKFCTIFIGSS